MFVPSMKYDLISRYISGNEERYPLNMVIVKMRQENVKSFSGSPIRFHDFFAQDTQAGSAIEDKIVLRVGINVNAWSISAPT